jgi:thiamine-phosphate pyrophosphorylase
VSLRNNSALDFKTFSGSKPILCYVTDRRSLQAAPQESLIEALLQKIETQAAAGVDWIQLREKDLSGKESAALARQALERVSRPARQEQAGTSVLPRILVNDRLDVALSENAGGVHLGENSLPAQEAKRLLLAFQTLHAMPRDFLIGVSCHSQEAAFSAASAGADYIFFGPVFGTPSKAAYGAPQGLERLAEICRSVAIPVLAIGGITLANASSCISAGASGIAAIRLFQDFADPASVVQSIRQRNF